MTSRGVVGFLLFGAVVFALGQAAVLLAPEDSKVASWWPAAGVSVAAVAVFYRSRWQLAAGIVVFSGLANLAGGRPFALALGFGLANAAEALVGAWWLRRSSADRPVLHGLVDVWRLAIAALLGAVTIGVGASLTVAILMHGSLTTTFVAVVPSHVAAVVLLVPLAMSTSPVARRSRTEVALSWVLAVAVPVLVFAPGQSLPIGFVALSPLVWAALRLGVRTVAAQLAVVGLAVTVLTARGAGPFAAGGHIGWSTSALVQFFVVVAASVMLPLAVAITERERALARATASEELFRRGFEDALVGMLLMRIEGTSLYVVEGNVVAAANLGVGHGDKISGDLRDDDGRSLGDIAARLAPGEGWRGEMSTMPGLDGMRRFDIALSHLSGTGPTALATCQVIDITDRHHSAVELERRAMSDHLTGLPNRLMFDQCLQHEVDVAVETGSALAVMFMDLDDFKLINDGFGHRAGDAVLAELGKRIGSVIRPGDMVARVGGDEFALVCPRVPTTEFALDLAQQVRKVADRPFVLDAVTYRISFSIGVTVSSANPTPGRLLAEADLALYAAKRVGNRSVQAYSSHLGDEAATRVRLEADLHTAFENGDFEMYMQPVIVMATGTIEAAEALIRWNHPDRGIVPPADWLGVAEQCGMMAKLGTWVLDESCRQAATWAQATGPGVRAPSLHVNVSARQLDAPGFADIVLATIERHRIDPFRLVLELTETYLAEIADHLIDDLKRLSDLGVRLAADDFGTGYSPLTRITELPISMIKIDKQFIDGITKNPRSLAITTSLVDLARTLGLEVVAEGIEEREQADLLCRLGCTTAQGYLWSRPVPAKDFLALIGGHVERQESTDRSPLDPLAV